MRQHKTMTEKAEEAIARGKAETRERKRLTEHLDSTEPWRHIQALRRSSRKRIASKRRDADPLGVLPAHYRPSA